MSQKVLAGRAEDPHLTGDVVTAKVDQVILAKTPNRVLAEAVADGLKKAVVEVAIAYDTRCFTVGAPRREDLAAADRVPRRAVELGVVTASAGLGFPGPVHLERFAAPARLAITDEPRLAGLGGGGMLTLALPPSQLASALRTGTAVVRPPRSVQVLLSGRMRPFVCVRDVALELLRRDLAGMVQAIDAAHGAPVVVEFTGPSARLLSVPDRATLCALAPRLGAAAAVFVSDEKTEVYLRDQRRSKAHRALVPDPGAPCEDALTVDLSAVDPLLLDADGTVRPVRELAGKPVSQVFLGGDTGAPLRDMLAAATLLKSKRVVPGQEFLVTFPSRQTLEVMGHAGGLVDLVATGARFLEPDPRLLTGELHGPLPDGVSLRTFEPEPSVQGARAGFVTASAETLAYAVATGQVGDPRSFKRPVRITVPRTFPTDDVLLARKKGKGKDARVDAPAPAPPNATPAGPVATLVLAVGRASLATTTADALAVVATGLDDLRALATEVDADRRVRAVVASHLPRGLTPLFVGAGVVPLVVAKARLAELASRGGDEARLTLDALPGAAGAPVTATLAVGPGKGAKGRGKADDGATLAAAPHELDWLRAGTARPSPDQGDKKKARKARGTKA